MFNAKKLFKLAYSYERSLGKTSLQGFGLHPAFRTYIVAARKAHSEMMYPSSPAYFDEDEQVTLEVVHAEFYL